MDSSCWGPLGSTWSRALLGHTPAHLALPKSSAASWASRADNKSNGRCVSATTRGLGFGCIRGERILTWIGLEEHILQWVRK